MTGVYYPGGVRCTDCHEMVYRVWERDDVPRRYCRRCLREWTGLAGLRPIRPQMYPSIETLRSWMEAYRP